MNTPLTIVMYHYVRPIAGSTYPRIKGLEFTDFEGQLDYIQQHYNIVSLADVIAATDGAELPESAALLTFDDGYSDHFEYVYPELKKRKLTGVFFPPVRAVRDHTVLDVNKIHFVLATVEHLQDVINHMEREVAQLGDVPVSSYREKHRIASRFDDADRAYLKRMLQFELPEDMRGALLDDIFREFVTKDEAAFAQALYLSESDIRIMLDGGMYFGGHGDTHRWLNHLSKEAQASEIKNSHEWLKSLGACDAFFTFCYPYGGYNDDTLELLRAHACSAAFTSKVALADFSQHDALELPRLDTNDLPKVADADIAEWTSALKAGAA